jgi:hypothetical protein
MKLLALIVVVACGSSKTKPLPAPSAQPGVTVKAARHMRDHKPTDESQRFVDGETAYVYSEGAAQHVWKKDGKVVWTDTMRRPFGWSHHALTVGRWLVDVVGKDGAKLGEAPLEVTAAPPGRDTRRTLATSFAAAVNQKDQAAVAAMLTPDASATFAGGDSLDMEAGAPDVARALVGLDHLVTEDCGPMCCSFQGSDLEVCFAGDRVRTATVDH